MRLIPVIFALIFIIQPLFSQDKYWIYFKDKAATNQLDAPVSDAYISQLENHGLSIINQSRWLNAVTVYLTEDELNFIRNMEFIQRTEPVGVYEYQGTENNDPDFHFVR